MRARYRRGECRARASSGRHRRVRSLGVSSGAETEPAGGWCVAGAGMRLVAAECDAMAATDSVIRLAKCQGSGVRRAFLARPRDGARPSSGAWRVTAVARVRGCVWMGSEGVPAGSRLTLGKAARSDSSRIQRLPEGASAYCQPGCRVRWHAPTCRCWRQPKSLPSRRRPPTAFRHMLHARPRDSLFFVIPPVPARSRVDLIFDPFTVSTDASRT